MGAVWDLGQEFRDEARGLVITPVNMRMTDDKDSVDIAFVCCTDVEEDALVEALFPVASSTTRHRPPSYRKYYTRSNWGSGKLSLVATRADSQGALSMYAALEELHRHYVPRLTLLIGIAGGLDSEIEIGDVVIASRVLWYERGKVTESGISRELQSWSMPLVTRNLVQGVVGELRREGPESRTSRANRRQADMLDFGISMRSYGSGEKVIAAELADVRNYLVTVDRKIAAVEMESGGFFAFFDLPREMQEPNLWLVIKGISDHADPAKSDSNQAMAAHHSVRASIEVGERLLRILGNS